VKLHLGVVDVPYTAGGETTYEVANHLEKKYHVMELFVEDVGVDHIARAFEESAKVVIEDTLSGAPPRDLSLTYEAEQDLEVAFRKFIDQKQLDFVEPGVPTEASLKGVNHRLKHPYAKGNPTRPSFRDTGLYQTSFKVWTE
jgi:hypothetical protein